LSVGDAPACAGPDRQTYVAAATAASQLGVAATIQEAEQHDHRQVQPSERVDPLVEGSRRFVEIAGPESVHIEMSASGPKKYYDAHRPLTEGDTCAHLQGWKTKGVCLHHPDGMTRVLCYNADTPKDWQHLVEAAQLLPSGDYLPLLEPSPVQAGEHAGNGHPWIIFDGLVNVSWSREPQSPAAWWQIRQARVCGLVYAHRWRGEHSRDRWTERGAGVARRADSCGDRTSIS